MCPTIIADNERDSPNRVCASHEFSIIFFGKPANALFHPQKGMSNLKASSTEPVGTLWDLVKSVATVIILMKKKTRDRN